MKKTLSYMRENLHTGLALTFIIILILLVTFGPLFIQDPKVIDTANMLEGPSMKHLFGTDPLGRDYLARCIYGARVSLLIAFFSVLTSILIGLVVGLISGYFGGLIDEILMRIIDLISSVPPIILLTAVNALLRPGLLSIILVLGFFSWMEIARLVRAETLIYKEMDYVKYSKHIGSRLSYILFSHILPNILPTVITASTIGISGSILAESSLSFLGLGVQEPNSSLGSLVQDSQTYISSAPHIPVIPGLIIFLIVHSFNKLGESLNKKTGAINE